MGEGRGIAVAGLVVGIVGDNQMWLSGLWVITKCGCPSSYVMMNIMNMRSGQVYLSGLVASLLQL